MSVVRYSVLVGLVLCCAASLASAQEQRIALVIGNSDYPSAPLLNPANDARAVSAALRAQGFSVSEKLNLTQNGLKIAIRDYGDALKAAGRGTVGLFYFAGHGAQVAGQNYLIPVDAQIKDEGDVDIFAVSANGVMATVEDARNGFNIIILDACRNNPFARGFRSNTRGLAVMNAPTGTLIAYSTAPGQVALDGDGDNSPYTDALVRAMATPAISIERLFKTVRNDVLAATQGQQTPWESSSLTGDDYYLVPGAAAVAPPIQPTAPELRTASPELVMQAQILLQRLDYDPGPADGLGGRRTRTAVMAFQRAIGWPPDGLISEALVQRLASQELAAAVVVAPPQPAPPAPPPVTQGYAPGETFRDCATCPDMVVVPAGTFLMGSTEDDIAQVVAQGGRRQISLDEMPRHEVRIPRAFAVGKHEVTRAEFAAFAANRQLGTGCVIFNGSEWKPENSATWESPGFPQTERDPVVCVAWETAEAYAAWLSHQTGESYRLLSEAEWEYVARAGTQASQYWGKGAAAQCRYENGADRTAKREFQSWIVAGCEDGAVHTAPVGSYEANPFGLHDILGNVFEWTADCYHDSYSGAPNDGSARSGGNCENRVLRGGGWIGHPSDLRAGFRGAVPPRAPFHNFGFRVARDL